ncbi:TetR/AcrR family transcriptional regulator [Lentzea sp. NEAU-D7]|uniref:TetR/AcrR family transcriptional regulator n=1 Tax=Lentzea sp. NEAU-D7 TaxID=2994667 RepID=UPI00224A990A|nr:WHG domain-containing protein [Lentzea sp. NEAU-D7]MCX2950732.1 WHG domain-containing protein [Lentzea sp. NEAU-D7]
MSRPGCRQAIVTAATALVDRDRAVTLRAVSREADVPTSSIYQQFPDVPSILLAVCHEAFRELEAVVLGAPDAHAAGLAYLDFAVAHPRRYRVMFGAADLSSQALRLFTRVLADPDRAMTFWLGLHGLADQHTAIRRSSQFAVIAPRLITSLI